MWLMTFDAPMVHSESLVTVMPDRTWVLRLHVAAGVSIPAWRILASVAASMHIWIAFAAGRPVVVREISHSPALRFGNSSALAAVAAQASNAIKTIRFIILSRCYGPRRRFPPKPPFRFAGS